MSRDAFRPITTSTRLEVPRGHRIYTTGREVPAEYTIPSIGDSMSAVLGTAWAGSTIFAISERPEANKLQVTYSHTALPSRPWTRFRHLSIPKNHRLYTTTILIPISYTIPDVGMQIKDVASAGVPYLTEALGMAAGRQDDYIVAVRHPEAYGGYRLELDHMTVPVAAYSDYQTVACVFPSIYPNGTSFFPGGSMRRSRSVLGRVLYQFTRTTGAGSTWATWQADGTIWNFVSLGTGPFEVESYLAQAANEIFIDSDGNSGTVGQFLNGTFIAQDTIHDAITISIPGDLYYEIGESKPSATTYASWVANKTEIILSRTIDDWYGDIKMRRTVFVRAQ
ncbi:MAG: hypothetical protein LLG20_22650 [Acidobacteriales bacterium]|nr:hypothetical protein [Terriglobales bacterium]